MTKTVTRRSGARPALRLLSTLLIVSGSLLLADAAATLVWQEPVSSLYARLKQRDLQGQLDRLENVKPTPWRRRRSRSCPTRSAGWRSRPARWTAGPTRATPWAIRIDRIGLSSVVVEGTDAGDLRDGPGHYPGTPLPGQRGTVAIAGHRTTYGAPFRKIDKVGPRDEIKVVMPYGRFTYRVERTRIVTPTDVWVTQRVSYDRLILSACHPLYSAAKRIVVFARLVRSVPRGAAA